MLIHMQVELNTQRVVLNSPNYFLLQMSDCTTARCRDEKHVLEFTMEKPTNGCERLPE